jgi:signal transduction histidine kinase
MLVGQVWLHRAQGSSCLQLWSEVGVDLRTIRARTSRPRLWGCPQTPPTPGDPPYRRSHPWISRLRRARIWGTAWPILLATFVGFLAVLVTSARISERSLVLYMTLGIMAIGLVPLRRRAPLPVALVIVACFGFSSVAAGAYVVAVVFIATRRRWREILAVSLMYATAYVAEDRLMGPSRAPVWWVPILLAFLAHASLIVLGLFVGGRRELLSTLVDRAETAEREQAARMDQARVTERTHIAREMHDVLAHRISLVAMHAGALTYRDDLTRDQTAETAEVIRANAHLALTELRDVLGVLRDTNDHAKRPERPQPTLGALAELLEECNAAGNHVFYEASPQLTDRLAGLPDQVSRNAFRILQESLTNTRKHAPGLDVVVEIGGQPGGRLTLVVDNAMSGLVPGPDGGVARPLPGMGLIGLVERARLAGGELSHGVDKRGRFVVRAWVPWPT